MERWFARPARIMSPDEKDGTIAYSDVETRLVTMRWVLQFTRAKQAHDELLATWDQGAHLRASATVISNRVRKWRPRHPAGKAPLRFGNLAVGTVHVNALYQADFKKVDSGFFTRVDDFYAGLGVAQISLAVSGMIQQIAPGRSKLVIEEVGTYLRDTYELNGTQSLGSWGPTGLDSWAVAAPAVQVVREGALDDNRYYWSVSNGSFEAYRQHYKRGGDFVILSDIPRTRLVRPVIIEIAE